MARFQESKNHIMGTKPGKQRRDTTSPNPTSGPKLMNPGGAGNKNGGIPTHRTPNQKVPKGSPASRNEDAGGIRGSKEYKALMMTLKGKTMSKKPIRGGGKMIDGGGNAGNDY